MKKIFGGICLMLLFSTLHAQPCSRNGCKIAPYDTIRMFVVFADVINFPDSVNVPNWNYGELPAYKDQIIDYTATGILNSEASREFKEASFDRLKVIGDYYPRLIQINYSDLSTSFGLIHIGLPNIIDSLNLKPGSIFTQHGFQLNDFDLWDFLSPGDSLYKEKHHGPDNYIDVFVVIWRNSLINSNARTGGMFFKKNMFRLIKNMYGINSVIHVYYDNPSGVIRHELSHGLIGANRYHTGGAGTGACGHFLSNISGYSLLSSFNCNLRFCNGWDRWWLGWKNPNNTFFFSARNSNGDEQFSDLVYGQTLENNEFILRDFARYGDVVRIKLPYLKDYDTTVRNQYLWIENHQLDRESVECSSTRPKGIRFNIQVGNESIYGDDPQYPYVFLFDRGWSNYYVSLSSYGNYDFSYEKAGTNWMAYTTKERMNPFTGYHPAMLPAIDYTGNDSIFPSECINVLKIFKDNELSLDNHPIFGNKYDAFPVGSSIGISTNPSTSPLMTYVTYARLGLNNQGEMVGVPLAENNNHIFLNGLRIDIVQKYLDGSVKVKIVWDDYRVTQDVRWCGPIVLTEQVDLMPNKTITLDLGLTPTHPTHPMVFEGQKIFSDPTVFTCRNHSLFHQEEYSKVKVKNLSTLVLEEGSEYVLEDHAMLNIDSSACLIVKSGATLRVKGSGHVDVRKGGYICIESGANIILEDKQSSLSLHKGYIAGTSPDAPSGCNCINSPQNFAISGQGSIHSDYNYITFIQKRTYTGTAYETGRKVRAGYQVDFMMPYGNVNINNGADVIFDADLEVRLEPGFSVKQGAKFEARCGSN